MKVAELAMLTGYTPGFISQIENDITSPSIASIQRIAKTLDASISSFFDDARAKGRVVRRAERRKIVFPRVKVVDYLLSPSLSGHLQIMYTIIYVGGGSGKEPYTHDSDEECAIVLEGRLRIWVGEEVFHLNRGDSITFESRIPHRWENPGRRKAVVLWAMTPPSY